MAKIIGLIQWNTAEENAAFVEGVNDFRVGAEESENPWIESSRESVAWFDGWNAAKREIGDKLSEIVIDDSFEVDAETEEDAELDF